MVKKIIAELLEENQKEKQESKEKRKVKSKKIVAKKLRKRKCSWCREWFIPKRIGQIYCSDVCGDKKHNEDLKKTYHENRETPTPCSHCNKKVPLSALSKNNLCANCELNKKVCPYCKNTFIHKNDKRVFCSLRCNALQNQKKATDARKGPVYDLQEILDELVPYLKYDCTLPEACAQTGRSYSTVKSYLYGDYDLNEYPDIAEFRKQIKKAMNYIKIMARQTIVESIVSKKDTNSAKFIISNRDKRYQGGQDENGENKKTVVFKFDVGQSPFIQPTSEIKPEVEVEQDIEADDIPDNE